MSPCLSQRLPVCPSVSRSVSPILTRLLPVPDSSVFFFWGGSSPRAGLPWRQLEGDSVRVVPVSFPDSLPVQLGLGSRHKFRIVRVVPPSHRSRPGLSSGGCRPFSPGLSHPVSAGLFRPGAAFSAAFQHLPAPFSVSQRVPACPRLFQRVPARSSLSQPWPVWKRNRPGSCRVLWSLSTSLQARALLFGVEEPEAGVGGRKSVSDLFMRGLVDWFMGNRGWGA